MGLRTGPGDASLDRGGVARRTVAGQTPQEP